MWGLGIKEEGAVEILEIYWMGGLCKALDHDAEMIWMIWSPNLIAGSFRLSK